MKESYHKLSILIALIATILICILPMSLSPIWNGTIPGHRDQYERMAEAILHGHLYLEYDRIDPRLSTMENPYDPQARQEMGVNFEWDHAFYNEKYYMYFGVVPVFLVFLPYRILTGTALTTYKATQIFTASTIIGIFLLFSFLRKRLFQKMPFLLYLMLSVVVSFISVWYAVTAPAMYCTAIMSAVCMELISINLAVRGVEDVRQGRVDWIILVKLIGGSFSSALAFGCRPTIALAGLIQTPMLCRYRKIAKSRKMRVKSFFAIGIPYLLIAVFLMWYNYARFGNTFEFGQSYQLTVADQHGYRFFEEFRLGKILNGFMYQFASWVPIGETFPYVSYMGSFFAFPILLCILMLLQDEVRTKIKEKKMTGIIGVLLVLPMLITVMDAVYTPYMLTRYQLDVNFLLGIACFIAIGFRCETIKNKKHFFMFSVVILFLTGINFFLMLIVPYDGNATAYDPQLLMKIEKFVFWWK